MTLGIIIGKFKPFTDGHQYLINTAVQKVDKLVVIIAGKEDDIPHPKYRLKWMKNIYNTYSNIIFIRINDIYDPTDSNLWATLARKWLGIIEHNPSFITQLEHIDVLTQYLLEIKEVVPNYIFTSELYGDIFSYYMNLNSNSLIKCEHILVDLERNIVPISGTIIRKEPFKYKDYINKIVFRFYTKRFVFIGPESVYKTRITNDLSKLLNLPLVKEYGDEFCNNITINNELSLNQSNNQYNDINSILWTDEIFNYIGETQNKNENEYAENNSHIICDTNILSTIIFGERYMGREPILSNNILDHLDEFKINTIYFLMDFKDVDFIQNETNTRSEEIINCPITTEKTVREWMYKRFLKKLNDNNLNYHKLSGTYEKKLATALTIIKNQLIIDNINVNNNNETIIIINNTNENISYKYNDLIKSLYLDLLIFRKWEIILLLIFISINFIFTFIDFNQIIYPQNNSIFQWDNDTKNNIELWRRIIYLSSGIISFTGILSVVMATKRKISTYLWGIINSLFFGLYAFAYGYIGNFQLNIIFFLPLQLIGIYKWHNKMEDNSVIINKCNLWDIIKFLGGTMITTTAFYYEIPILTKLITNSDYIFINNIEAYLLDVITTSLSITAQILMIYRYREQWIIWIIVDILQIALYAGIAYGINNIIINIVIMWFVFLCNAFYGLYIWYK